MNYRKFSQEFQLASLILSLIGLKMILNQTSSPANLKIDPPVYNQTITRLALGEQLYSKNLTKIDLEKIPMVSTAIAEAIINQRQKLRKSKESNLKRLEAIKGIGVKKARTINQYLVLY